MSKEGFDQFQAKETPIPESVIELVRGATSVAQIRAQHQLVRYIGQEERILLQKGTTEVVKSPTRQ
jgi:hypothetical protein